MFKIGNVEIKNKVVIAPMAGITDLPYRLILKQFDASLMTTELISAKGICYSYKNNFEKEKLLLATDKKEKPIALQLFGNDKEMFVRAASLLYEDYDIIDINMGCPVKKVFNNHEGSYLLNDVFTASGIVEALNKHFNDKIPITCKIRIGIDDNHLIAPEFAKAMENAGASAITVHGRTVKAMYSGNINKEVIKKVKERVKIPVIANGNIFSIYDAKELLDYTNADAVALGRGIKGNPFLVRECIKYLDENEILPPPTITEIKNIMLTHIKSELEFRGEKQALNELKHVIFSYTHNLKNSKKFRIEINKVNSINELIDLVEKFFNN